MTHDSPVKTTPATSPITTINRRGTPGLAPPPDDAVQLSCNTDIQSLLNQLQLESRGEVQGGAGREGREKKQEERYDGQVELRYMTEKLCCVVTAVLRRL